MDFFNQNYDDNCTSTLSSCKTTNWLFGGAAGTCLFDNNKNGYYCQCPDGYEGNDDFISYNDCHVSLRVRYIVRLVSLSITGLCVLISLVFFTKVSFIYGIFYIPDENNNNNNNYNHSNRGKHKGDTNGTYNNNSSTKDNNNLSPVSAGNGMFSSSSLLKTGKNKKGNNNNITNNEVNNRSRSDLRATNDEGVEQDEEDEDDVNIFDKNKMEIESTGNIPPALSIKAAPTSSNNLEREASTANDKPSPKTTPVQSLIRPASDLDVQSGRSSSLGILIMGQVPSIKDMGNQPKKSDASSSFVQKRIKKLPRPSLIALKELAPGASIGVGPRSNLVAALQERKRKRLTLYLAFLFFSFTLSAFVYLALQIFLGMSFRNKDGVAMFFIACYVGCALQGLWCWALLYIGSLPSIGLYGKLFNMKSILVRYPNMVEYIVLIHAPLTSLVCFCLLFVLPYVDPVHSLEYLISLALFIAFCALEFGILFHKICGMLLSCFDALKEQLDQADGSIGTKDGKRKKQLIDARFSVFRTRLLADICSIAVCAVFLLIVFLVDVRSQLWILAPVVTAAANLVVLLILLSVVQREMRISKRKRNSSDSRTQDKKLPQQSILSSSLPHVRE